MTVQKALNIQKHICEFRKMFWTKIEKMAGEPISNCIKRILTACAYNTLMSLRNITAQSVIEIEFHINSCAHGLVQELDCCFTKFSKIKKCSSYCQAIETWLYPFWWFWSNAWESNRTKSPLVRHTEGIVENGLKKWKTCGKTCSIYWHNKIFFDIHISIKWKIVLQCVEGKFIVTISEDHMYVNKTLEHSMNNIQDSIHFDINVLCYSRLFFYSSTLCWRQQNSCKRRCVTIRRACELPWST